MAHLLKVHVDNLFIGKGSNMIKITHESYHQKNRHEKQFLMKKNL